jgi:Contractile injection system tape measure protein
MTHRIRHTALQLQLPSEQGMGELQAELSQLFRERVLPELSDLFDECVPADQTWVVPRIAVELGQFSTDTDVETWVTRCKTALREALLQQVPSNSAQQEATVLTKIPTQRRIWQAFLFFLQHGRLPWWFQPTQREQWEREVLSSLTNEPATAWAELSSLLRQHPVALQRLTAQFSAEWILQMAILGTTDLPDAQVSELLQRFKSEAGYQPEATRQLLRQLWQQLVESPAYTASIGSFLARQMKGEAYSVSEGIKAFLQKTTSGKAPTESPALPNQSMDLGSDPAEQSWTIDNAGLVLLAPYLPQLLQQDTLWKDGQWSRPDAQESAVGLLRQLSHGSAESAEYELSFCKVLAGLPVDYSIAPTAPPTEAQTALVQALIEAAIQHWTALGTCSVEGLQETFLKRKGRLSRRSDGHWLLQPERQTVDILLDRLPWGYGLVRLPWMGVMVWVEW